MKTIFLTDNEIKILKKHLTCPDKTCIRSILAKVEKVDITGLADSYGINIQRFRHNCVLPFSYLASRVMKFSRLLQSSLMYRAAGAPSMTLWSKVRDRPMAG